MEDTSSYRLPITIGAAFLGALLSCVASQPGDTILSRVNQSAQGDGSALEVISKTIRELGIIKLFSGLEARLLHSVVIVVSQLLIYDSIKTFFGIAAAGGAGH
jgi:solute carrier family 25 (mitochondrial phosphate transporter), member 3